MRHDPGCPGHDNPMDFVRCTNMHGAQIVCGCEDAQAMRRNFRILNEEEFALLAGVTVETLGEWRGAESGPSYTKLGRTVFYRNDDVTQWIELRTVRVHDKLAPWQVHPSIRQPTEADLDPRRPRTAGDF